MPWLVLDTTFAAEATLTSVSAQIASKATLMAPADLPVPVEKFKEKFGEEWQTVLAEGRAFNAIEACKQLDVDANALKEIWEGSKEKDKLIKLGGGFYCALLEVEGKPPIYTFNAFFMSMRTKFTAADAVIHYYVVKFDPAKLSWADFRGKVQLCFLRVPLPTTHTHCTDHDCAYLTSVGGCTGPRAE